MSKADQTFLREAEALLGPKGLIRDAALIAPWLTDWRGRYHGACLALAAPANTAEVAALVALCARHHVPIVPQGGNSGMSGGATPVASGDQLLLSLRRLNRIDAPDRDTRTISCGAGVILQTLHEAADAAGLRFALTLGGKGSATIGGLIATNAGGTQVLRHGTMRAQVLGLEAVLADGAVLDLMVPLKKDNRGFDLKQLFIGSEGTLGVITAARLQLTPAIAQRQVLWLGLPSIDAARTALVALDAAFAAEMEGFEVMPQRCLDAVLDHLPAARAPLSGSHPWHALVELVSSDRSDDLTGRAELALSGLLDQGIMSDAVFATSDAQADALWLLRDSISAALRGKGPAMQHDIAVPVDRMAAFLTLASARVEAAFPGSQAYGFGHLGDGNIHFHVTAPPGAEPDSWRAGPGTAASRLVHDLVTEWGGTISAEHGIGQMKRDELARTADPVRLAVMAQVKAALDPQGLFNPGKLLPLAPCGARP